MGRLDESIVEVVYVLSPVGSPVEKRITKLDDTTRKVAMFAFTAVMVRTD